MDAYLSLLLVIGASIAFGHFAPETTPSPIPAAPRSVPTRAAFWYSWPLLLAIVLVPVIWNLDVGEPFQQRDFQQADYDLKKLDKLIQQYAPQGEILFITQRQLQVFHLVPETRVVPDYELMTLMEMAMAGNADYFARFDQDLQNHRFALIISDRQQGGLQDPETRLFAEENNAWVSSVSGPILKYYKEAMWFDTQGIQLLTPR